MHDLYSSLMDGVAPSLVKGSDLGRLLGTIVVKVKRVRRSGFDLPISARNSATCSAASSETMPAVRLRGGNNENQSTESCCCAHRLCQAIAR